MTNVACFHGQRYTLLSKDKRKSRYDHTSPEGRAILTPNQFILCYFIAYDPLLVSIITKRCHSIFENIPRWVTKACHEITLATHTDGQRVRYYRNVVHLFVHIQCTVVITIYKRGLGVELQYSIFTGGGGGGV